MINTKRSLLFSLCLFSGAASAVADSVAEPFPQCLDRLHSQAQARGYPESILAALAAVKPIERTIKLDRNQPEFVQTFYGYFSARVTDYRIERGRELLEEHREFLNSLTRRYGVPAQYLVAFWALESNFGRHIGKMPILDTLATLACDQRRSEFFTGELFYALDLMKVYGFSAEEMAGSWAGAIGQTQFLPSAYLRYGIDGDGDDRVDLWHNQADALTSAANYLQQLGWQPALRWGREVSLPEGFPYYLAGLDTPRSIEEWQRLGVKKADGTPLPDAAVDASLLVPAGSDGPKFLVYDNFHVIMKWNRSQYYALAVGYLADRINGAGHLLQPPPQSQPLTREQITTLQTALKERGFDPGKIDGQLGPQTVAAIRGFQKHMNLLADGFADRELLDVLLASPLP